MSTSKQLIIILIKEWLSGTLTFETFCVGVITVLMTIFIGTNDWEHVAFYIAFVIVFALIYLVTYKAKKPDRKATMSDTINVKNLSAAVVRIKEVYEDKLNQANETLVAEKMKNSKLAERLDILAKAKAESIKIGD
jgi:hypothetical protein